MRKKYLKIFHNYKKIMGNFEEKKNRRGIRKPLLFWFQKYLFRKTTKYLGFFRKIFSGKFNSGNLEKNLFRKSCRKLEKMAEKMSDFFTKKNIQKNLCEVIHRVIHSLHRQAKTKNKSFLYFINDIVLIDYKKPLKLIVTRFKMY